MNKVYILVRVDKEDGTYASQRIVSVYKYASDAQEAQKENPDTERYWYAIEIWDLK